MLQSIYSIDAFLPVESEKFFEKLNSSGPIPSKPVSCAILSKFWEPGMNSLAEAAAQIAGSQTWFDSFCPRKLPPARHILIRGCTAEIKDDLQLVTIALA